MVKVIVEREEIVVIMEKVVRVVSVVNAPTPMATIATIAFDK